MPDLQPTDGVPSLPTHAQSPQLVKRADELVKLLANRRQIKFVWYFLKILFCDLLHIWLFHDFFFKWSKEFFILFIQDIFGKKLTTDTALPVFFYLIRFPYLPCPVGPLFPRSDFLDRFMFAIIFGPYLVPFQSVLFYRKRTYWNGT